MRTILALTVATVISAPAAAAVVSVTQHGPGPTSLNGVIAVGDVLSGIQATQLVPVLPASGFHPAVSDPDDKIPAFTDDDGIRGVGALTGLLRDFPGSGAGAITVQYDLPGPTDIAEIRVLTGNEVTDGRVFSAFTVYTSTNHGNSFSLLGYFQSDPSGTINREWGSTLVRVFDDAEGVLAGGVTNLHLALYAVSDQQNMMRDPFDGMNPFTGVDDGFAEAFISPLVFEIDVIGIVVPEPASAWLLACGLALPWIYGRRRVSLTR